MKALKLSICIPTYNRKKEVVDLVKSILSNRCEDIEVVVTDNVSTDGTIEALATIDDRRLRICKNQVAIPAFNNMVQSIFNANGKYAFYCNDRDLIYANKLDDLIDILRTSEYSFIFTTRRKEENQGDLQIFKKGYDSLIHHNCTHHPTGMVFNSDLMREYLEKENYFSYLKDMYPLSFLMRDLFKYEKSAIYNIGCWDERPQEFKSKNIAGTMIGKTLYFYPEMSILLMKDTLTHIFKVNDYSLTKNEEYTLVNYVIRYFHLCLLSYKSNMISKYETTHYGIDRKFITTIKMVSIFMTYYKECIIFLDENDFSSDIKNSLEKSYPAMLVFIIIRSLRLSLSIVKIKLVELMNREKAKF
ncbi:MAG: glycosyltransferase family 2 protein [Peptostreptococcaceae bacterium]|nr:glycosyltransferase family 2 protein [Peptostreptococcaceae bacterium]